MKPTTDARGFDRSRRVRCQASFTRAIRGGVRVADRTLQVWAARSPSGQTRLGIIVSRRHGNAVIRNRHKRILREAFRHVRASLPVGLDLICRPQLGRRLERDATAEALTRLARRAADLLARREPER